MVQQTTRCNNSVSHLICLVPWSVREIWGDECEAKSYKMAREVGKAAPAVTESLVSMAVIVFRTPPCYEKHIPSQWQTDWKSIACRRS